MNPDWAPTMKPASGQDENQMRDDESTLLLGPDQGESVKDRSRERLQSRKMTKILSALATCATIFALILVIVLIVKREW